MKTVHIFDIDSTIADNSHRARLLEKICAICLSKKSDGHHAPCHTCGMETEDIIDQAAWDKFFDPVLVGQDVPIDGAQRYISRLRSLNQEIHFLTGRSEADVRRVTQQWLRNHFNKTDQEELIMRPRHEEELKASMYKEAAFLRFRNSRSYPKDTLFYFYEDDTHIVNMYNQYGIVVKCPEAWAYLMPSVPYLTEETHLRSR